MEELINDFLNSQSLGDEQESLSLKESNVTSFCEANGQRFSFEDINPSLRHKFIRSLLDELCNRQDESSKCLNYTARCLEALRVLSRDKSNLGEMISEKSCRIFLKLAGLCQTAAQLDVEIVVNESVVVIEALKCVCNLVFQNAEFREYTIKYNCTEAVCVRLTWFGRSDLPRDVKFYDLRLLFVLTALEANERTTALHANAVEFLTVALDQVVPGCEERRVLLSKELEVRENDSESPLPSRCNLPDVSLDKDAVELFGEILKVLFNITINISQEQPDNNLQQSCYKLIFILRHMLIKCKDLPQEPKNLQNNIINMLINLPFLSYNLLFWKIPKMEAKEILKNFEVDQCKNKHPIIFEFFNVEAIHKLLVILDQRLVDNLNLKETLSPLLSVLTTVARHNRIIRKYLRQEVLPSLGYVGMEKPEKLDTIRGRLVRHLTSAVHEVKESVGEFLFVLCKENVSRLIKYVGYGNAAGFLADHGLMAGNNDETAGNYSTDDEESDSEEYEQIKDQIDPMTGAQVDPNVENPLDKMTEEEKELEAERLANLLSKLNKQGIVKPVAIGPDGKPVEISNEEDQ
ncbi:synembryn-A-like [Dendronephthya gigantea]|uniref:synembryn-A-like n=1 Tax=Dendronephthya gigantea TaxID=151771 RepID=UPI001069295C|nr:synembryn-A-like [Dendronephthya gigantea]